MMYQICVELFNGPERVRMTQPKQSTAQLNQRIERLQEFSRHGVFESPRVCDSSKKSIPQQSR